MCRYPAVMRGVHYPSVAAAARAAGVTDKTAHKHLERWGHLEYLGIGKKKSQPKKWKSFRAFGVEFKNQREAAEALCVCRKTIYNFYRSESTRQSILRAVMEYKLRMERESEK